ncbi:hypothetical protein D3C76_373370 [compost metagenome]
MVRNERGYTLVMVLLMIVIIMILGTAIVSASIGGAKRTEKREDDVQSLHLAGKALNEAAAYLVSLYGDNTDIDPEELQLLMAQDQLDLLKDKLTTNTQLDDAAGKIVGITAVQRNEYDFTSYIVTLTAEANVKGTIRRLQQEVIIQSYPEFLNYAFGSENDVIINGSPYGIGSIYAGNKLLIDNQAQYIYKNSTEVRKKDTQYPHLEENGSVYVQSVDDIEYYDSLTSGYRPFLSAGSSKTITDLLGITNDQIVLRDKKKFVSINVEESFIDKAAEATHHETSARNHIKQAIDAHDYSELSEVLQDFGVTKMPEPPEKPILPEDLDDEAAMDEYYAAKALYDDYLKSFEGITETMLHDGSLTLDGIEYKTLEYTDHSKDVQGDWFIVNGDLNIINYNDSEPLKVKANILVTGNVTINGSIILVDATIFALGKTRVQDAQIRGLSGGVDRKQLILLSKGEILVNRVDAFNNYGEYSSSKTNTLDAFFYTDDAAELYGVGSAFWLRGGFFAKGNLTINAVLGDASDGGTDIIFDPLAQDMLNKLQSRFVIEYSNQFFKQQFSGLPRVKQLSVQVGSKQLLPNP